jgi:hypothetical protein
MNFENDKLKYVVIFIFVIAITFIVLCFFGSNDTFKLGKLNRFNNMFNNKLNKLDEGFANNNNFIVDVLLGKKFDDNSQNRTHLSDNIDESNNKINMVFSTYNTGINNDENSEFIFLRTNIEDSDNYKKLLGDMIYETKTSNLQNNDNILNMIRPTDDFPHLLNYIPGINNAVPLTKDDIKLDDSNDYSIIYTKVKEYELTNFALNIMGLKFSDIYKTNNMNKIYNFYNKGREDIEFLNKTTSQILDTNNNNIKYISTNNDKEIFDLIDTAKYFEVLELYYNDISIKINNIDKDTLYAEYISSIIITPLSATGLSDSSLTRIYAGYTIPELNYTIPFRLKGGSSIDNNNKYRLKDEINDLMYLNDDSTNITVYTSLLTNFKVEIETIKLFENTEMEVIFNYPYIEYDAPATADGAPATADGAPTFAPLNTSASKLVNSIRSIYRNKEFKDLNDKITTYMDNLKKIIGKNEIFNLQIPLEIILMKDPEVDDDYVIFGDIINSHNINNNDSNINILSKFVKIPRRCCRKTEGYYGDPDNKSILQFTGRNNIDYNIYQHPKYKTFKVFESNADVTKKIIFDIQPCSKDVTLYEDNIKKFNELKTKCNNIEKINTSMKIKDNSFNKLEIQSKLFKINKNKNHLDELKDEISNLQTEVSHKDIIQTNYNRKKLQNHNEKKELQIYEAIKRINNGDTLGININYPKEVLDHLIDQCKNKTLSKCKTDDTLLKKLENIKENTINKKSNDFLSNEVNNNNNIENIRLIPDVNSDEFKKNYIRTSLLNVL